jgi:hypothetical protein
MDWRTAAWRAAREVRVVVGERLEEVERFRSIWVDASRF